MLLTLFIVLISALITSIVVTLSYYIYFIDELKGFKSAKCIKVHSALPDKVKYKARVRGYNLLRDYINLVHRIYLTRLAILIALTILVCSIGLKK